jgi:hypothetical protein
MPVYVKYYKIMLAGITFLHIWRYDIDALLTQASMPWNWIRCLGTGFVFSLVDYIALFG